MGSDYCGTTGKIKYATPQAANNVRQYMGKRLSRVKGKAYRCPDCKCYHVASDGKGDKR